MNLVNIIYRYVKRFINSDELIKLLENIDKNKFSTCENREIIELIKSVKDIIANTTIEIDQVEENKRNSINRILTSFEKVKPSDDAEANEFVINQIEHLKKEKEKVRDIGPRYEKLYKLLTNNSSYIKYCKKMNDKEFLNFITQFIYAPLTPKINQEVFDDLVKVSIKEDKREVLWRLAVNYNNKNKDFTLIENYFIDKRDDYYLIELISAVKEDLDMEKLFKNVIATNDKEFMSNCYNRAKNMALFTDEEFEKIKKWLRNIKKIYIK